MLPKLDLTKRMFDLMLALIIVILVFLLLIIIIIILKLTSSGPAIYYSKRVGRYNKNFTMLKFRTMRLGTPKIASHLLKNPEMYITPFGSFLRRTSLDELPQLLNMIKGDMSFVGPRPALSNQYDLIILRKKAKVHFLLPGITGWAKINGRDNLSITDKVALDEEYLKHKSFCFDIKILWVTFLKVIFQKDISH
jgi:O-antigen biosynthesis protein WbqP